MSRETRVRSMQTEDLNTVVAIEREAFDYPWSEQNFRDSLEGGHLCRVLMCGSEQVGHYILTVAAGDATVLNIAVHPEFQGQGLGELLMRYLLKEALAEGAEFCFLEVRPSNTAAIALYQKLGFAEAGRRRNYYDAPGGREDALVMCLDTIMLGDV